MGLQFYNLRRTMYMRSNYMEDNNTMNWPIALGIAGLLVVIIMMAIRGAGCL